MYALKFCEDVLKGKRLKILLIIIILTVISLTWVLLNFEKYYFPNSASYIAHKYINSRSNFLDESRDSFEEDLNNLIKPNKIIFKGEKIVHIDLKGAPPKISYYKHFFKLLVKLGATGVLMEYEDMFPYHGPLLGNISAANAYTLNDIKIINNLAKSMNLKLIPLVQTFGHVEFILKLKEWIPLREDPKYPSVICPSHNSTLTVIKELLDQVIKAHPFSKIIHIGADEVFILGKCEKCFIKMNMNGWTKQKLFLHHVSTVASIVKEKYPNMRVLMWDDQFRKVRQEDLEQWKIASLVEPVVWKYTRTIYNYLGSSLWDMYANVFPRIWIASAFKGATGSDKYTTDIGYHVDNHKSWMEVVSEYSGKIIFEGIVITGWQRYDHFAVLCELLPVGIPSLAMSLYLIQGYIDTTLIPPQRVASLLQCENPYALLGPALGTPKCSFPGGNILEGALKLQQLSEDFTKLIEDSQVKGWMTDYNINHQYSNVLLVESAVKNLNMYKMQLVQIESDMMVYMSKVYDNYTISEWIETYVKPMDNKIENIWEAKEKLLAKDYWPRRPFLNEKIDL